MAEAAAYPTTPPWPTTYGELHTQTTVARADRAEARKEVDAELRRIVEGLDAYKHRDLLGSGSAFEGLKVWRPNEYDFMLVDNDGDLRLRNDQASAFLDGEAHDPEGFRRAFAAAVKDVAMCGARTQGPGVQLQIPLSRGNVSVDLIPCKRVQVETVPVAWRPAQKLAPDAKIFAVAKQDESGTWRWRLSFSMLEREYITQVPMGAKMCLHFVKYLTEGRRPRTLKTYVLKNAWLSFMVREGLTDEPEKDRHTQLAFTGRFLDHTIKMIESRCVPLFFAPTVNLLKPDFPIHEVTMLLRTVKDKLSQL